MSDDLVKRCAECDCDKGGIYCNWIASSPQEYRKRIAQLERELSAERDMVHQLAGDLGDALSELATERALADLLYDDVQNMSWIETGGMTAYRKARGL